MENLSSYDLDVLSEVPFHDTNKENDMSSQSVQDNQCSEQPFFNNTIEIDITSDSNIISYEQYLQETETPVVQSTSSSTQQDELLMSVIEEMSSHVTFHIFQVYANDAYVNKTSSFYDESHKTALGYQNPFYLSQARWKVPALYDGNTIVKTHATLSVTHTEETLELAEESRLKLLAKQDDPSLKKHKVNLKPVDYVALNKLSEHFAKHFVPQKQFSAEQSYWLHISQPVVVKPQVLSEPVLKKEIPRELPSIRKYEVQTDMSADMSVQGTRWQAEVSVRGTRVRESMPIMGNNEAVGRRKKDQNTLRSSNMSGG
ncbi:hypothetical protein Tco_0328544 [Tanacetum coccineum]